MGEFWPISWHGRGTWLAQALKLEQNRMVRRLRVLVVSFSAARARGTRARLRRAGYDVSLATTFSGGRRKLLRVPDLLIADVRMGAFNGLHLAMRALWAGIPSIVIGPHDCVLQREASSLGTRYLSGDVDAYAMLALVEDLASMRLARVTCVGPAAGVDLPKAAAVDYSGDPAATIH